MAVTMRVEGVEDILRRLQQVSPSVQKKYLAASVRVVAKKHEKTIKSLVNRGPTGNLKRSVGVLVDKKRKASTATAVIGFRRNGTGKSNQLGFHSWWIESGVKARQSKSGRPLAVPTKVARHYKYFMPDLTKVGKNRFVNTQTGGDFLFLNRVKGFAGTGRFRQWADATLPRIRSELVDVLGKNVDKAIAEQARRDAHPRAT